MRDMVPLINGKDLMDCSLEDIRIMLDNPDYRESEYLDFKRNFAFLEMEKGKQRDEKVSEFRSDVCAFANSDGGYPCIANMLRIRCRDILKPGKRLAI